MNFDHIRSDFVSDTGDARTAFRKRRFPFAGRRFNSCVAVIVAGQMLFSMDAPAQAESSNGDSYYQLGERYRFGDDAHQVDMGAAFRAFQKALQAGDSRAHYYLGNHYFLGEGVEKSYRSAAGHYLKAIESGSDEDISCYLIASCYDHLGDRANFMRYIQRSIDLEYPPAFYLVGAKLAEEHQKSFSTSAHLWNPSVRRPDINKMRAACHFWTKGAELGDSGCKVQLARLHIEGIFATQDERKASQYLEEAWADGDSDAAILLSYLHSRQSGDLFSPAKAFLYAGKAAEMGVAEGYYNLAMCYEKGLGVDVSIPMRDKNLKIAAEMGSRSAGDALQRLRAPANASGYVTCYACGGHGDVRWNDGDTTGCGKCKGTGTISQQDADLYRDSGREMLDRISNFLGVN